MKQFYSQAISSNNKSLWFAFTVRPDQKYRRTD